MFKYNFIANDYIQTQNLINDLKDLLTNRDWILSDEPEYVFILGGDGTFLKAVNVYSESIDKISFIPFKSGGVGFYTNHNLVDNLENLIESVEKKTIKKLSYELLEVEFNNSSKFALNEVKIINETNSFYANIYVDDLFLEEFHGTGIVFSTSTGTTGYMKATGGAIIFNNNSEIYEMNEIFPVSTNKYRTINAPIIFSKQNVITIKEKSKNQEIIIDTINYKVCPGEIKIKLSNKKIAVIESNQDWSKIDILRDIFVIDRNKIK